MIRQFTHVSLILSALVLAGCPSTAEKPGGPAAGQRSGPDHVHADRGPHGGELINLGREAYHAELVLPTHHAGEQETVTVYLLDATAENSIAIEAREVTLKLRHDGRGEQFTLTAAPEAGDEEGTSSRFTSSEPKLLDLVHKEEIEGELVVTIEGKQYRGNIAHHHHEGEDRHDHDGHSHPH